MDIYTKDTILPNLYLNNCTSMIVNIFLHCDMLWLQFHQITISDDFEFKKRNIFAMCLQYFFFFFSKKVPLSLHETQILFVLEVGCIKERFPKDSVKLLLWASHLQVLYYPLFSFSLMYNIIMVNLATQDWHIHWN